MNANGARPYCKQVDACVAGSRGRCRLCHASPNSRNQAIIAYHGNGARTFKAVSVHFGLSPQRVRKIITAAGITGKKITRRSWSDLTRDQVLLLRRLCSHGVPTSVAHEEVRR